MQDLSVSEKEFLAILHVVHKSKYYLCGHHFIIKTDHQSIKHILEQKADTALQQKWISKLLGLDYEVKYKIGKENKPADALSRKEQGDSDAIIVVIPNWVIEVQRSYEQDLEFLPTVQAKTVQGAAYPSFALQGGVLRKDNKTSVGTGTELRNKIIRILHDSAIGAYQCQAFDICQRSKSRTYALPRFIAAIAYSQLRVGIHL
ncbi:UNVERIFIED_CONTAM: hypothetical protein Slati_3700800 [Sesamum latifolium]|uniref:Reverse transcriptase RNase H-like domain-containing protein n=1 Tax=Sesamum latifolium TaxID=2727402 RepID=A0AAW2U1G0_9LAMI